MASNCLVFKAAPNTISRGRASRGRGARRSRRQGGDSVGKYFGDAWSLAKRTAVGLNEIRKLINVEHKYIDVNATSPSGRSGTVTLLTPIQQGDNINEREGDSIKIQSLEICGAVYRATAASFSETVRVLVVRDLQNAGAAPTASDVLETLGTVYSAFQPLDFISGNDLNKRFTVVMDEMVCLDTYHLVTPISFKTTHDCHVYFRSNGSTVASSGNGTYFLIVVSTSNTDPATFDFNSRIRFTDN